MTTFSSQGPLCCSQNSPLGPTHIVMRRAVLTVLNALGPACSRGEAIAKMIANGVAHIGVPALLETLQYPYAYDLSWLLIAKDP